MTNKDRILTHIAASPGATYSSLWRALHITIPALYVHIRRLEIAGLVRREGGIGRRRARFFAVEQATGKDDTPER